MMFFEVTSIKLIVQLFIIFYGHAKWGEGVNQSNQLPNSTII